MPLGESDGVPLTTDKSDTADMQVDDSGARALLSDRGHVRAAIISPVQALSMEPVASVRGESPPVSPSTVTVPVVASTISPGPPLASAPPAPSLRARAINELASTERVYLGHLLRLTTLFLMPLRGQDPRPAAAAALSSAAGPRTAAYGSAPPPRPASMPASASAGSTGSSGDAYRASGSLAPPEGTGETPAGGYSRLAGGNAGSGRPFSYPPGSGVLPASGAVVLPPLPPQLGVAIPLPSGGGEGGLSTRRRAASLGSGRDGSGASDYARIGRILTPGEHEAVFGSLDQLLPLQASLLAQLVEEGCCCEGAAGGNSGDVGTARGRGSVLDPPVGAVMRSFAPFLKMYARYVNGHAAADALLRRILSDRPALRSFVSAAEADPSSAGQSLHSLLAMPVQRVPRYLLLLRELAKHTPLDHPDARDTGRALELVAAVAASLNESIARHEASLAVLHLQARLTPQPQPSLVAPHRSLVLSGPLGKLCRPFPRVQRYAMFLLSDCLVYGVDEGGDTGSGSGGAGEDDGCDTGPRGMPSAPGSSDHARHGSIGSSLSSESQFSRVRLHQVIRLLGVRSNPGLPRQLRSAGVDASTGAPSPLAHAFVILGQPKSLVAVADSAQAKAAWVSALTRVLSSLEAQRASFGREALSASYPAAPVLPLAEVRTGCMGACEVCAHGFGVTRRRHVCGGCGAAVCGSCSTVVDRASLASPIPHAVGQSRDDAADTAPVSSCAAPDAHSDSLVSGLTALPALREGRDSTAAAPSGDATLSRGRSMSFQLSHMSPRPRSHGTDDRRRGSVISGGSGSVGEWDWDLEWDWGSSAGGLGDIGGDMASLSPALVANGSGYDACDTASVAGGSGHSFASAQASGVAGGSGGSGSDAAGAHARSRVRTGSALDEAPPSALNLPWAGGGHAGLGERLAGALGLSRAARDRKQIRLCSRCRPRVPLPASGGHAVESPFGQLGAGLQSYASAAAAPLTPAEAGYSRVASGAPSEARGTALSAPSISEAPPRLTNSDIAPRPLGRPQTIGAPVRDRSVSPPPRPPRAGRAVAVCHTAPDLGGGTREGGPLESFSRSPVSTAVAALLPASSTGASPSPELLTLPGGGRGAGASTGVSGIPLAPHSAAAAPPTSSPGDPFAAELTRATTGGGEASVSRDTPPPPAFPEAARAAGSAATRRSPPDFVGRGNPFALTDPLSGPPAAVSAAERDQASAPQLAVSAANRPASSQPQLQPQPTLQSPPEPGPVPVPGAGTGLRSGIAAASDLTERLRRMSQGKPDTPVASWPAPAQRPPGPIAAPVLSPNTLDAEALDRAQASEGVPAWMRMHPARATVASQPPAKAPPLRYEPPKLPLAPPISPAVPSTGPPSVSPPRVPARSASSTHGSAGSSSGGARTPLFPLTSVGAQNASALGTGPGFLPPSQTVLGAPFTVSLQQQTSHCEPPTQPAPPYQLHTSAPAPSSLDRGYNHGGESTYGGGAGAGAGWIFGDLAGRPSLAPSLSAGQQDTGPSQQHPDQPWKPRTQPQFKPVPPAYGSGNSPVQLEHPSRTGYGMRQPALGPAAGSSGCEPVSSYVGHGYGAPMLPSVALPGRAPPLQPPQHHAHAPSYGAEVRYGMPVPMPVAVPAPPPRGPASGSTGPFAQMQCQQPDPRSRQPQQPYQAPNPHQTYHQPPPQIPLKAEGWPPQQMQQTQQTQPEARWSEGALVMSGPAPPPYPQLRAEPMLRSADPRYMPQPLGACNPPPQRLQPQQPSWQGVGASVAGPASSVASQYPHGPGRLGDHGPAIGPPRPLQPPGYYRPG